MITPYKIVLVLVRYYLLEGASLSTTLIIPFFHIMREEMMEIGSMMRIRKPTMPYREPPPDTRTTTDAIVTSIMTGMTPMIPFFTTFFPELVLENRPSVREPNRAGMM